MYEIGTEFFCQILCAFLAVHTTALKYQRIWENFILLFKDLSTRQTSLNGETFPQYVLNTNAKSTFSALYSLTRPTPFEELLVVHVLAVFNRKVGRKRLQCARIFVNAALVRRVV